MLVMFCCYFSALWTLSFSLTLQLEAKQQIAANLANFAYDPFNYECMRELNVIDLFLDCLAEETPLLQQFGMGGLCNCCNGMLSSGN